MSDYISREAALTELQNPELFNVSPRFLQILRDLPAADVEPVRRWIPCSEKMPNPGERVLATDGGFVGEMYIDNRGRWDRYNVTYIQELMAFDILWWMPLPEPPKEEDDETIDG